MASDRNVVMDSSSNSSSMSQWSKAFLAFLRDSKYQDTQLKAQNIKNIYNLLFVPGVHHQDLGEAPSPDDLIQFMIGQGDLMCEGEFIKIAPIN